MMGTTFDERAEALARTNGFTWPLQESELRIEQIDFYADSRLLKRTLPGESLKCRLFLQVMLGNQVRSGQVNFTCEEFRDQTQAFFGPELCAEHQLHEHPFIMGMLHGEHAVAYLKV